MDPRTWFLLLALVMIFLLPRADGLTGAALDSEPDELMALGEGNDRA